ERRSDAARGRPVDSNTVKDFMLMVVHAEQMLSFQKFATVLNASEQGGDAVGV
ncbi:unnamed protein product, partial [Durusdinium trenchii]